MVLKEVLISQVLSVLQFLLVIGIGYIATKLVSEIISDLFKKPTFIKLINELGYDTPIIDLILIMIKYIMYFITFIIALAQFGFTTFIFDLILLLIALFILFVFIYSFKDILPNAASGLYLSKFKALKKGDYIKLGNYEGEISDINLMSIIIKDEMDRLIIIPNVNASKKEIIKLPKIEKNLKDDN